MRRATSDTAFKMVCRDRWMDRGAFSFALIGSPPPQGDFLIIKKFTNYHSQGLQINGIPDMDLTGKNLKFPLT